MLTLFYLFFFKETFLKQTSLPFMTTLYNIERDALRCRFSVQDSSWLPLPLVQGFTWQLSGKESACNAGDTGDVGSIPGLGRSPVKGQDNPLQYSCLENPTDRGAWQGHKESDMTKAFTHAVHLSDAKSSSPRRVTQSIVQLAYFHFLFTSALLDR